eukprot:GEMP01007063.1.p1 GENE.GEMP01007063.1~~GEMP01007063.1.p1  ORF type:complete len:730 (+),score=198.18 GEMP01007063.1:149-2338(+)
MDAFIASKRPRNARPFQRQGTGFFARNFSTIEEFMAYATESHKKLKNALVVPGNQVTYEEKLEYAFLGLFLSHWSKSESFPDMFEKFQAEIHAHVKKNPAMHGMFFQVLSLIHSHFVATNSMKPSLVIKTPVPQVLPPAAWTGQNANVKRGSAIGQVGGLRSYASPLIPVNMPVMQFYFNPGAAPELPPATDADALPCAEKMTLDENSTARGLSSRSGVSPLPSPKYDFSVGELVEYYSSTNKRYVKSVVKRLLPSGNYELDCKQYALASHIRASKTEEPRMGDDTDVTQLVPRQNIGTGEGVASFANPSRGAPTESATRPCRLNGAGQNTGGSYSLNLTGDSVLHASDDGGRPALITMPTSPVHWRAESDTATGASRTSVNSSVHNSVNSSARNSVNTLAHNSVNTSARNSINSSARNSVSSSAHTFVNISVRTSVNNGPGRISVNKDSGYIAINDDSARGSVSGSVGAALGSFLPEEPLRIGECALSRTVVIPPPSPRTEKNNNIVRKYEQAQDGPKTTRNDDGDGDGDGVGDARGEHKTVAHKNKEGSTMQERAEALFRRSGTLWMLQANEELDEDSTKDDGSIKRKSFDTHDLELDEDSTPDGAIMRKGERTGRNKIRSSRPVRRAGSSGSRGRSSSMEQRDGSEQSVDGERAFSDGVKRVGRARRVSFQDEKHDRAIVNENDDKTAKEEIASSVGSTPSPQGRARHSQFVSRDARLLRELDDAW